MSIDFDDFTLPFTLLFLFRLRRYIKHSRQCFIGYPNTSNFVKNTPLRVVFSTLFSVFGYPDETLVLVFDRLLHNCTDHCTFTVAVAYYNNYFLLAFCDVKGTLITHLPSFLVIETR